MEPDKYYMNLAVATSARANCIGRKVGAVLVSRDRVVSTGYNGTPSKFTNCLDGGCVRCRNNATPGEKYDLCICVHAEQNALLAAAREGIHTHKTRVFTTLQPCFVCLKECLQAGVTQVIYLEQSSLYEDDPELTAQYWELADHVDDGVQAIEDFADEWPDLALGSPAAV